MFYSFSENCVKSLPNKTMHAYESIEQSSEELGDCLTIETTKERYLGKNDACITSLLY